MKSSKEAKKISILIKDTTGKERDSLSNPHRTAAEEAAETVLSAGLTEGIRGRSIRITLREPVKSAKSTWNITNAAFMAGLSNESPAQLCPEHMAAIMPAVIPSTGVDITLAQVSIFHDDISVNYLVPADTTAAEVIEAAFGEKTVFDGVSYVLRPGVSRRQVLAPEITNLLTSHPTE